jgi:hypothetical protein
MATRRNPPAIPKPLAKVPLVEDANLLGPLVLFFTGGLSRVVIAIQNLKFLASAKEGGFKIIFDIWNGVGWWLAIGGAIAWLLYSRPWATRQKAPTWGLLAACVFMAVVFGSLATIQLSGAMPQVIADQGISVRGTGLFNCQADINGHQLVSFQKDYRVTLVCVAVDRAIDQLTDTRISVSELHEITDSIIPMVAAHSPNGPAVVTGPSVSIDLLPVVVPRQVAWEKLKTLQDIRQLGGKILAPKYY